jgi:hypothetical protein
LIDGQRVVARVCFISSLTLLIERSCKKCAA